ncbi:MAG: FG-GAP repeat protein, partial [Minisyncoccia bacterium]
MNVTGTINVSGNLLKDGNLIIGDDIVDLEQFVPENDTVDFNAPLSQDLKPGVSNTHNLGRDSLDSTPGRWGSVYFTDNFTNTTNLFPDTAIISDQIFINGITRQIDTLQSNDELIVNSDTGQVYVEDIKFIKNAGWVVKFILSNPNAFNTPASDLFGLSLDTSDSYIIAGVYNEDDAGGLSSGKAYIFSALTGTLLYTLDNPNPFGTSANDLFGYSVSISESYAIVGAYQEDVTGINSSGKAYIYSTTTGALLYTLDNPILDDDAFGFSVSITESFAIIGAPYAFGPAVASG